MQREGGTLSNVSCAMMEGVPAGDGGSAADVSASRRRLPLDIFTCSIYVLLWLSDFYRREVFSTLTNVRRGLGYSIYGSSTTYAYAIGF